MATKTVHEISIEADTSSTKAAIRDLSAEYVRVQKKIIEGNGEVTKSELDIVAAYDGRIKELKNLERAQQQVARLDREAAKGVDALKASVKELANAQTSSIKSAESMKAQMVDMAKRALTLAAAMKAVREVTDYVASGFRSIAEAAKDAQVLGLTSEQFEGLNIKAKEVGASIDDLRNVFGALHRAGKEPWAALLEAADTLATMETNAERSKYMVEQFGESGAKLVPALKGGRDSIYEAMEAAQDYGLVLSGPALQAHAELTAEIQRLELQSEGFSRRLSTEVTPSITAFLKSIEPTAEQLDKVAGAVKVVTHLVLYFAEAMRTAADITTSAVRGIVTGMSQAAANTVMVISEMKSAIETLARTGSLEAGQGQFDRAMKRLEETARREFKATWDANTGAIDRAAERLDKLDDAMKQVADTSKEVGDNLRGPAYVDQGPVFDDKTKARLAREAAEQKRRAEQARREQKRRAEQARRERERQQAEAERAAEKLAADEERAARKRIDDWTKIELSKLKQKIAIDKKYDELVAKADEERAKELEKAAEEAARKAEAVMRSLQSELLRGAESAGKILADGLFGPMEEGVNRMEQMGKRLLALLAEIAVKAAAAFAVQAATGTAGGGIGGAIASAVGFASGGYVSGPGTATCDSIPARLSNGEYVINAKTVDQYGRAFFDRLNNLMPTAFAGGGSAGSSEIVIVNPPTERDFENFVSSNRGRRLIINATRGLS